MALLETAWTFLAESHTSVSAVSSVVSALAAAATAGWAIASWRVSSRLEAIERGRDRRELALLTLYQHPEGLDSFQIGAIFNAGKSATIIQSGYVQLEPEVCLPFLSADGSRPVCGALLGPGEMLPIIFHADDMHKKHVFNDPKIVIHAVHDKAPVILPIDLSLLPLAKVDGERIASDLLSRRSDNEFMHVTGPRTGGYSSMPE